MRNILQETGHEGEMHNNMQILSYHPKSGNYYVRINMGDCYGIARLSYTDIVNGIMPVKILGKLVGNPYWHLDDGSTILFDINGKEILIDTEDFDKINHITWRAHPPTCNRSNHNTWYAFGGTWDKENKKWTQYALHRYVMEVLEDDIQIDHKDLDGLNNRKYNLRKATQTENARHKSLYRNNKQGFTGIRKDERNGIYQARITVNGKQIYLGESYDIEEAKRLRLEAEKKYFGEFSTARFDDNQKQ